MVAVALIVDAASASLVALEVLVVVLVEVLVGLEVTRVILPHRSSHCFPFRILHFLLPIHYIHVIW